MNSTQRMQTRIVLQRNARSMLLTKRRQLRVVNAPLVLNNNPVSFSKHKSSLNGLLATSVERMQIRIASQRCSRNLLMSERRRGMIE
jgi:hypothetical protein